LNPFTQAGIVITAAGRGHFQRQSGADELLITLDDGQQFTAPASLIGQQADGQNFLNLTLSDIHQRLRADLASAGPVNTASTGEEVVVPVIEEELAVGVRPVETGRVRVNKRVHEVAEDVETLLQRDEVDVERVPVNEYVTDTVPIEYADDRVVIPIYEEVVVVEKRLLLKEKLVVTRRQVQERAVQPVNRRVEEAIVERLPAGGAGPASG
jgi:uncharacterized protein (TIGR02271 family)